MSPSQRNRRIAGATTALIEYITVWDEHRLADDVADFAFGNPQEPVLRGYSEALVAAAQPTGKDHFAYKRSEERARLSVAKKLVEWRGMPFEPEDIAMTTGAFGAIATALHTFVDVGEEVIFSVPPWFFYEQMVLNAGAVPVKVGVRDDFDLDVTAIESAITERTRMVIVNTPNNPTGRIYPPETLAALSDALTRASGRHGAPIYLLSDEPYSRLVFSDATFTSPAAHYSRTLIAYSYGKVLLTPGQRLGWLAMTPQMPERESLRDAIFLTQVACGWLFPNAVMQYAIDDLDGLSIDLVELEAKRDLLVSELTELGYAVRPPEGTFYLWVRSPEPDDVAFAARLAERHVLVLPGTTCETPGYFRISLTASMDMIQRSLPAFAQIGSPNR